ncbi:hypothetical protein BDV36DRAFT_269940 [Aspergillus pseudocaelatus]|uniref:Uncharacterized protein n=1 Tax=Aspergillus pseudocaelatus TaxID=1825620 RepID=A0ABQ6W7G9_9EURO|nr:hypothetical protein BDV36DRAFT_269940 [Aspergillus pseudocaelatus]
MKESQTNTKENDHPRPQSTTQNQYPGHNSPNNIPPHPRPVDYFQNNAIPSHRHTRPSTIIERPYSVFYTRIIRPNPPSNPQHPPQQNRIQNPPLNPLQPT